MSIEVSLHQAGPIPLDVSFDCGAGELLTLIGPSGAGKSTVLRAIAGLIRPSSGRVVCDGALWFDSDKQVFRSPRQRGVGFVFQDYALFPHLSAEGNVMVALRHLPASRRAERARELLSLVNLAGLEDRKPGALSGGQCQRVALARALARDPAVLLLDEPFSAVDQMTRQRLQRELANLRSSVRVPMILVTHDITEAAALADSICVLHHGSSLQRAAPEDVRLRPVSPQVARLMGQTNIFSGRLIGPARGGESGRLEWGTRCLEINETGSFQAGDDVDWMIPNSHILLHRRTRPSRGERENPVTGRIHEVTPLGEVTAVTMAVADASDQRLNFTVAAHTAKRNDLRAGADVAVSLLADGLHLMMPEG